MKHVMLQRTCWSSNNVLIEAQQQQINVMKTELETRTMLVDTMQQGSVDARQQEQFLESVVLQADGVIDGLKETIEQKDGYIAKLDETIAQERQRLETYGRDQAFAMWRILTDEDIPTNRYYSMCGKPKYLSRAVKKLKLKHPNIKLIFRKAHVPNPINLRNRLKTAGIGRSKGNYFTSMVSVDKLIHKLGELYTIVKSEQAIIKQ